MHGGSGTWQDRLANCPQSIKRSRWSERSQGSNVVGRSQVSRWPEDRRVQGGRKITGQKWSTKDHRPQRDIIPVRICSRLLQSRPSPLTWCVKARAMSERFQVRLERGVSAVQLGIRLHWRQPDIRRLLSTALRGLGRCVQAIASLWSTVARR